MEDDLIIGLDELDGLLEEAEKMLEQATSYAQIGKLHLWTTAHVWDTQSGLREVDANAWREFPTGQGFFKFLNLHIEVDTQEFNPELQFKYERRVQIKGQPWFKKLGNGKTERVPSDWEAIWEPSVKDATGMESMSKALKWLEGKYVKILDVPQQPTKRQPEPEYNTAKLDKVYEGRDEAHADWASMRGGVQTESAVESTSQYNSDLVSTVKTLAQNMNDPQAIASAIGGGVTADDVKNILNQ